jgi:hypothetical protein
VQSLILKVALRTRGAERTLVILRLNGIPLSMMPQDAGQSLPCDDTLRGGLPALGCPANVVARLKAKARSVSWHTGHCLVGDVSLERRGDALRTAVKLDRADRKPWSDDGAVAGSVPVSAWS